MNNRKKIDEKDQIMIDELRETLIDITRKVRMRKRPTADAIRMLAQLTASYHKLLVSFGLLKSSGRSGGGAGYHDPMKHGDPDYYTALERAGK
jgi:hypothetical protein